MILSLGCGDGAGDAGGSGSCSRMPCCGRARLKDATYAISHALELLLTEDQEVIEAFATNAAEKPFTDCVRSWDLNRCSEEFDVGRTGLSSREFKIQPKLSIPLTYTSSHIPHKD